MITAEQGQLEISVRVQVPVQDSCSKERSGTASLVPTDVLKRFPGVSSALTKDP